MYISCKNLGTFEYFLGARLGTGICLSQRKYTLELLPESGLAASKPSAVPMEQNHKLTTCEYDDLGGSNQADSFSL